jgi:esterase/lipase
MPHHLTNITEKSLSDHCKQWLANEELLFDQDYQCHAIAGESKDKTIGKPYLLHHPKNNKGVLLIHGLMAAPFEVKQWADALYVQGYNVYAPRLTGHGTSVIDLATRNKMEWVNAVERGYKILAECNDNIILAGFSTGAALALNIAIKNPNNFSALICISAPLKIKKFSANFASPINQWNKLLNKLNVGKAKKEFVTNHADNPHINYLRCPVSSIVQIQSLMKGVRQKLASIDLPILVMHATNDPKVDVQSSRDVYRLIGSKDKTYHEIDFDRHGIINGDISTQVFSQVDLFLQKQLLQKQPA